MRTPVLVWRAIALAILFSSLAAANSSESKEHRIGVRTSSEQQGGQLPLQQAHLIGPAEEATKSTSVHPRAEEDENDRLGFGHAFLASISVIVVSELGDKTWFIAAIMAMRHSRLTVFVGAMAALGLMTVLSVCLGWATQIVPRKVTYYASSALFAIFGIKLLLEGWKMSPNEAQEELAEAELEVQKKESEIAKSLDSPIDVEAGRGPTAVYDASNNYRVVFRFVSKIFLEAFTLTFLAEWGDRSQLTTIILAAREDVFGVTVGGILGHMICTGIAVVGGRLVAQQISVRTVTLIGGVVFIVFALSAVILNPDAS